MILMTICTICWNEFKWRPNLQVCSNECKLERRRQQYKERVDSKPKEMRICKKCGMEYPVRMGKHTMCLKCLEWTKRGKEKNKIRKCQFCWKRFPERMWWNKFCSEECKIANYNKTRREKNAKNKDTIRLCKRCWRPFIYKGNKIFCWKCSFCKECNKPLLIPHYIFCSIKCSAVWNWKHNYTKMNKNRVEWQIPLTVFDKKSGRSKLCAWARSVYKRDWYKCRICQCKDWINAHHILNVRGYPSQMYNLDNWITLCHNCHHELHNTCGRRWAIDSREYLKGKWIKINLNNSLSNIEIDSLINSLIEKGWWVSTGLVCDKEFCELDNHIHLFPWDYNNNALINRLSHLNWETKRVYHTKVVSISNPLAQEFYEANHTQWRWEINLSYALEKDWVIYACMSFTQKKGIHTLTRFATKSWYRIGHWASKLFKQYISDFNPDYVVSYSDITKTNWGVYDALGFEMEWFCGKSYWWVDQITLKPYRRRACQKQNMHRLPNFDHKYKYLENKRDSFWQQTEKELMETHWYFKVYDAWMRRHVWHKKSS